MHRIVPAIVLSFVLLVSGVAAAFGHVDVSGGSDVTFVAETSAEDGNCDGASFESLPPFYGDSNASPPHHFVGQFEVTIPNGVDCNFFVGLFREDGPHPLFQTEKEYNVTGDGGTDVYTSEIWDCRHDHQEYDRKKYASDVFVPSPQGGTAPFDFDGDSDYTDWDEPSDIPGDPGPGAGDAFSGSWIGGNFGQCSLEGGSSPSGE